MHVRSWRTRTPPPSAVLIEFLVVCALCSLPSSLNPAVSCVWLVLLVFSPCGHGVSFVVVRPLMLRIKARMNQKDSDAGLVLLVILSALCFLLLSSDPHDRHMLIEGVAALVECGRGIFGWFCW